jgi:hypothetical protein
MRGLPVLITLIASFLTTGVFAGGFAVEIEYKNNSCTAPHKVKYSALNHCTECNGCGSIYSYQKVAVDATTFTTYTYTTTDCTGTASIQATATVGTCVPGGSDATKVTGFIAAGSLSITDFAFATLTFSDVACSAGNVREMQAFEGDTCLYDSSPPKKVMYHCAPNVVGYYKEENNPGTCTVNPSSYSTFSNQTSLRATTNKGVCYNDDGSGIRELLLCNAGNFFYRNTSLAASNDPPVGPYNNNQILTSAGNSPLYCTGTDCAVIYGLPGSSGSSKNDDDDNDSTIIISVVVPVVAVATAGAGFFFWKNNAKRNGGTAASAAEDAL